MSDYLPANQVRCFLKRKFAEISNEDVAPLTYQHAVLIIRTKAQLIWCVDRYMDGDPRVLRYGPMGSWDVSLVEDFSEVFSAFRNRKMRNFNEDLRFWDVASATNMREMFKVVRRSTEIYHDGIHGSVTDMSHMFW